MTETTPLPLPENKTYYPALDGLRAVAVLLVFASHFIDLPAALSWGFTGVDIFFVLSGFLITGILFDSQRRADRYRIFLYPAHAAHFSVVLRCAAVAGVAVPGV